MFLHTGVSVDFSKDSSKSGKLGVIQKDALSKPEWDPLKMKAMYFLGQTGRGAIFFQGQIPRGAMFAMGANKKWWGLCLFIYLMFAYENMKKSCYLFK